MAKEQNCHELTFGNIGGRPFTVLHTGRCNQHRGFPPGADRPAHSYLSLNASEVTSTIGEKTYSRMRRLSVLISTVAAMPGVSATVWPSAVITLLSGMSVTGNT